MNESEQDLPGEKNPQVVFSWKAPLRPYMQKSPKIIRFYLALALLISLIIFFFGDRIILIPVWALFFIFYVFTVTPPPDIEHKITPFGIETAQTPLRWDVLDHFYFNPRFGYDVLVLITHGHSVISKTVVKVEMTQNIPTEGGLGCL